VLGPSPDALYERGYVTLEPGSVLLAYTDGITEAEDPKGEDYGLGRLRQLLLSRAWAGARELVDAVMADVARFSGGDFRTDDQTVVAVVRRR
jgi:sigma-B regulation protein RsbU (phosphoserine phosphatase)